MGINTFAVVLSAASCIAAAVGAWCSWRSARAAERSARAIEKQVSPSVNAVRQGRDGVRIVNTGCVPVSIVEIGYVIDGERQRFGQIVELPTIQAGGQCFIPGLDCSDAGLYVVVGNGSAFVFFVEEQ